MNAFHQNLRLRGWNPVTYILRPNIRAYIPFACHDHRPYPQKEFLDFLIFFSIETRSFEQTFVDDAIL